MNTSLLFQSGIRKLNDEFFTEFVCFAEKYKLIPNFTALITFMQAEFLFAQKEEQKSLSRKSDITFVKKSFENLNLNNDAMALSELEVGHRTLCYVKSTIHRYLTVKSTIHR